MKQLPREHAHIRPILLRTPRLRLRELTLADAPLLQALCSDPEVMRFTGDAPCRDRAEAEQLAAFLVGLYDRFGMGRLAVELVATGEFLGWCGLRPRGGAAVDLGYRFHARCWGRGYATEAGRATLAFGFEDLKLDRIVGRVDPANVASARVLLKLGMRFVGEVDDEGAPSGRLRIYEATRARDHEPSPST